MIDIFFIFISLGVYLWTVFGLRKAILKDKKILTYSEFKANYPKGKLIALMHTILSPIVFIGFLLTGASFSVNFSEGNYEIAKGMFLAVSGLILFSGFFELLTNVCPIYGVLMKKKQNQRFIIGQGVKKLGLIRIFLGTMILSGTFHFIYF